MTENTTETTAPAIDWAATLKKSEAERVKGEKATKVSGALLWKGTLEAVSDFVQNRGDDDSGEGLYNDVMLALGGKHRRGDASKIKTVALATRDNGFNPTDYSNLSQAYKAAIASTKTVVEHEAEDTVADEVIISITVPPTVQSVTPADAAVLVIKQGVDEASRLLLDAIGDNPMVHRSLLRALSQEVAGRKQDADAKAKQEKAEAAAAAKEQAAQEATEVTEDKPKKKAALKKAAPRKAPKKAEPVEDTPAEQEKVEEPTLDDLYGDAPAEEAPVEEAPVEEAPKKRTAPRRAPRRVKP